LGFDCNAVDKHKPLTGVNVDANEWDSITRVFAARALIHCLADTTMPGIHSFFFSNVFLAASCARGWVRVTAGTFMTLSC
jgi:hypothetical protein